MSGLTGQSRYFDAGQADPQSHFYPLNGFLGSKYDRKNYNLTKVI